MVSCTLQRIGNPNPMSPPFPYICPKGWSMKLSHLSETLIGSEIVKLGGEIREKIGQGHRIYNFTVGDFDTSIFPIPKELEDAIIPINRFTPLDNYKHSFIYIKKSLSNGVTPLDKKKICLVQYK